MYTTPNSVEILGENDKKYIRMDFSLDDQKSRCNPTPQQRAIYNFHEARHSNEADDIYASAWFKRTKDFMKHAHQNAHVVLDSWQEVEILEFGVFFLAHPVAGYSLWHFLCACNELDAIVCGRPPIDDWIKLKPFSYTETEEDQNAWEEALRDLKGRIESGDLEGENLLQKLYAIFCGLEKLDVTFQTVEDTFISNLGSKMFAEEMMNTIRTAKEWRCQKIANLSLADDTLSVEEDLSMCSISAYVHDTDGTQPVPRN
ncbi:hypothetical protein G7Y89_g9941 [Cudoniella acicularis]|uniref:Uncharacterized protein n=1 Tax=Cudoniella acicularis TaxID=354080 RepID=A0A8H4RG04_9HELO|nr:hypothetical protein G7Y89_g9941 [Cudoniella acicularis]